MRALRSLLFLIGQSISAILYSPISMLAYPLPPLLRSRIIGGWAHFALWWLRVTCNLSFTVRGVENLPDQPAVILSKHQSAWETIAFQLIFPPQAWVLKRELLWIPFFGWGLAASRPISINRSAGIRALEHLVREGTERLNEGRWVVVFPEGTRMPPGEHGRYNPGGAMLAVRSGAPIVPVAHNAGEFWPRRGLLKKPGVITVAIGPCIDTRGRRPKPVNNEAEAWIEETMREIGDR
jgi:1-acyl-sn-glycerol-3-phosphate acyltransferase